MKEPIKVTVNEIDFYIHQLGAFKAANLSGELLKLVGPALGGITASLTKGDKNGGDSVLDANIDDLLPAFTQGLGSLSGEAVETLLRKLLIDNKTVAYTPEGKDLPVFVKESDIDDLFGGDIQYMYLLAFQVLKANYQSFFKKLGSLFGSASEKIQKKLGSNSTEG